MSCTNPLRTNRRTLRERDLVCRPPLSGNFVMAESGARNRADPCKAMLIEAVRRAAGIQQACHVGHQSLAHEPRGGLRWTGSGVPRPHSWELCGTGFRGSPCCRYPITRFACFLGRPPSAWNFVKPGHAVLPKSIITLNVPYRATIPCARTGGDSASGAPRLFRLG
jgi:hypothetical protein